MKFFMLLLSLSICSSCIITNNVQLPFGQEGIRETLIMGPRAAQPIIAYLDLSGGIAYGSDRGIDPEDVQKLISHIKEQDRVVGVILSINSPGGSGAASEEIYRMLRLFKEETELPIYAYVPEVAASGGYYIAVAADKIICNPNAITGSIGVISIFINIEQLLEEKLQVEVVTVKSGKFKDAGSLFRKMVPEERVYWQGLVDHFYGNFVGVVASARKLDRAKLVALADGRVFQPVFAKAAGLIDETGTLIDVVKSLEEQTGHRNVKVVKYGASPRGLSLFSNAHGSGIMPSVEEELKKLSAERLPSIMYYAPTPTATFE